ncbi:thioesterase family protein [Halomonas sp. YLGW01]|uniref:acyl-CoA thioesterase n=1 Tax=Halomonas sp. YLGW01 TaxID=2773308 RepID=UPI00177F1AB5|nr:thioesterase family protein [Halomonas sp. YLGW01]
MPRVRLEFPADAILHRHSLSVRITDMNYGRHLGHDALVSLLHEARTEALASRGLREWDLEGCPSVVADLAIQYQGEAAWPDALIVETAIPPVEGKALCVYHRVVREHDQRPVATARLNLVLLDPATGKPVPVPESVQEALSPAWPRPEGGA